MNTKQLIITCIIAVLCVGQSLSDVFFLLLIHEHYYEWSDI